MKRRRPRRMHLSSVVMTCRGGNSDLDSPHRQRHPYMRPRLIVEFDTNLNNHDLQKPLDSDAITNSIDPSESTGSSLSLSFDASQYLQRVNNTTLQIQQPQNTNSSIITPSSTPTSTNPPIHAIYTLLTQSILLLPSLLLTRRLLNFASNAIIDYFRGRYLRTTFTRLERAYLRYYEFPAAIRAVFRVSAQIGILMCWKGVVRWWLGVVRSGGEDAMLYSVFLDAGSLSLEREEGSYLPCHSGGGVPWLCGVVWIACVVGAGHACAMALSKWGGPLRLQAASASQQPQKPTHVLSWIIHHPIQWIRGLDEWKHFSSLINLRKNGNQSESRRRRWRAFNPDPLLFPATWMPLRWLQIYVIARAFATDPGQYRWCSAEKQTVIVHRLMNVYLVQLALGDEWSRVFLGEYRVGLGILVVSFYFLALSCMVFITFTMNVGSSVLLIPSLLAAIISGFMNISIFWNRMGTREQKKALVAMGWVDKS